MKIRRAVLVAGGLVTASGVAALVTFLPAPRGAEAPADPRQSPPRVLIAKAAPVQGHDRRFTGVIGARVQSDLGFRVPGKITERLVDVGQQVRTGQPLMRIDDTDLRLALAARRNAVDAARAAVAQLAPDEKRYAELLAAGWVTRQRYEQARSARDAALANLAAAEADARFAGNETAYSVLTADAEGTVIETLGEPGQVVSAGQPVVRIARSGPREAVVALPETVRPRIGQRAEASVFGDGDRRQTAHLRQLSDAADPQTRTYEARFVLDGPAASAPLGATVTVRIPLDLGTSEVAVPLGAVLDDGMQTGVWGLDRASSTVHLRPVTLVGLDGETALVSGLAPGDPVVALGAHLLRDGAAVVPAFGKGVTP